MVVGGVVIRQLQLKRRVGTNFIRGDNLEVQEFTHSLQYG